MPTANVKIHPATADDQEMTSGRLRAADQQNMDPEEDWKILHARFPWKRYHSESIEQKYNVFRKEKMLSISKHLPLSSAMFGGIVFALSIFHFNEEKVPAILTTCMFLLVNIAVLSLYCAKEIQTNTSHIVSLFVFVLPFSLLVCVQLLDFREISASGMRVEWVAFLVFLAFVTLPVRYWLCCAMVLVLFLGQLSAVVFKLFKNKSSPMDILYQVSLSSSIVFCTCTFGSYMFYRTDTHLRNAFYVMKDSHLTSTAIERTQALQKNLLSAVLPKAVVARISRDFSLYRSNSFRELCSKCHEDVSMLFCTVTGIGDFADKSPKSCIVLINELMSQFSYQAKKHFMEEVGWSLNEYQAVCGAMETRVDHPILTVYTAMAILDYMKELKHKVKLPNVHARIAIHTGDIVTAVLGARHWKYDLLGDDVIRAKHLLERAHNGQVLISEATKSTLHDEFIIEAIGESDFSVRYVVKRFNGDDYEKGIAARRVHRKGLEEDVQTLRDYNTKRNELKRKRSSIQAMYNSSLKPVCERDRETLSPVYVGLCVFSVLTNFYVTAVVSNISLAQIIALTIAVLFLLSFIAINFFISKVQKQHRSTLTLIVGHLFLVGFVTYFCTSGVFLMQAEISTRSQHHNVTLSSPSARPHLCCFPSFMAVTLTVLTVALTACDVASLMTKLCCVVITAVFHHVVGYGVLPGTSEWITGVPPSSILPNYDISIYFTGICVSVILLNIQISSMFGRLMAFTTRKKRKRQLLLDCRQKYRTLVLELFPYELATSLLQHNNNQKDVLEGTVSPVGIAVLSVCFDENTEDSDNEATTTAYKAIQFTDNIDKVLLDVSFSGIHRLVSSVTSHIFISGLCDGVQETTGDSSHLGQMMRFLRHIQNLCSEMNISYMKAGVHHGPVLSSIVGGSKARWGVWGTTLDIAKEIHIAAKPNMITVSQEAGDILRKFGHKFEEGEEEDVISTNQPMAVTVLTYGRH
ncbi:adenylate cyclase type 8-like isoform X1 [Crassostrea angulata]|uniref:adenylate cyclase type 8-like isoform X1 n=1 Tax=Magallana angulata TaxID=2784310 RepID=UPI0022B0F728|nr:adenylate cyclase type 8-like isoform X1 [Crassostrea angulata]